MSVYRFFSTFVCIAALGGPLAAQAQTTPPPDPAASVAPASGSGHHHRHGHRNSLMHAIQAVNLTPAQKQQIATFRDQEKTANRNADAATKAANGAKMRQQIMGILTADQKAQVSTQMHRAKTPQPGGSPMPMAAPSPAMSPRS